MTTTPESMSMKDLDAMICWECEHIGRLVTLRNKYPLHSDQWFNLDYRIDGMVDVLESFIYFLDRFHG